MNSTITFLVFTYLISQNKTPRVNNPPPFFTKNSRGEAARKFWAFFLFLGGKTQKICIKKGWVNTPPLFLGRVGLFDRGCFISRDKVHLNSVWRVQNSHTFSPYCRVFQSVKKSKNCTCPRDRLSTVSDTMMPLNSNKISRSFALQIPQI